MFRRSKLRTEAGRGYGLMLVALLVVLVPSICLVWLMNRALQNERLAVHQKLLEAYGGHLTLAQERLESRIRVMSAELERAATNLGAAELFAREVIAGRADAVLCFDPSGRMIYPVAAQVKRPIPNDEWNEAERLEVSDPPAAAKAYERIARADQAELAAQALQAQARCLLRAGHLESAAAIWENLSTNPRFSHATDAQGRWVAPAATLMLLTRKEAAGAANFAALSQRFERQLDYTNAPMPSAQRRFLLRELVKYRPEDSWKSLLAAENLAANLVENASVSEWMTGKPGVRPGPENGLWQLASEHGLVVTVHRTSALAARLEKLTMAEALPNDLALALLPPGEKGHAIMTSVAAGSLLSGWNLGVSLKQPTSLNSLARQGTASYFWIGTLALATAGILAALMLHLVRRQLALNQLRTDLVANVSHELKTPLSSMRLLVDTLLHAPRIDEPAAREYLELIARENQRLSRLIDNFLTFSRIERNKYQFTFKTVDAGTVIENAAQAVRERFNVAGCRFEADKPVSPAVFVGDGDAIVTALINLLDNAWKYSGDEKVIELSVGVSPGHVIFSVRDNGKGIPGRELKRIFRRFYQVDQRLSRSGGGCGLGLSIVQFIMRAHNGRSEVESQPGVGTTFRLILPLAESVPASRGLESTEPQAENKIEPARPLGTS